MNTKEQAPESCPFCGAGLNGLPQVGVMVFRCGTMVSHGNTHDEQSEQCRSRESGGLIVATIKRLEAEKAFLAESHLAQENKRLVAEMLELRNAIQRDTDAFLRLTRERDEEAAKADHLCVYSTSLETANRQLTKERDDLFARMKRLWKRCVGWVTWYKSDRDVNRAWRRIYADMIRERSRLERELEAHAHDLSPAMVQARNDQLAAENTKLRAQVDRLKWAGDDLLRDNKSPANISKWFGARNDAL